jgi:ankyrin repeat protein
MGAVRKVYTVAYPMQDRNTPLRLAAQRRNLQMVQMLLCAGAGYEAVIKVRPQCY